VKKQITTVDEYIDTFPAETKVAFERIRNIIKSVAPNATETISYKMPAMVSNGYLVYFAGYKSHIGFYPGAATIEKFREEIKNYKNAKGSVQFPIIQDLPKDLISEMVIFKLKLNEARAAKKLADKSNLLKIEC